MGRFGAFKNMTSPIPAVYKSVIRAVSDMIDTINTQGLYSEPVGYHNWEERTPETQLSQNTLIGVDGFSFDENGGFWLVRFSLAVSSFRDTNLLTEVELIGDIQEIFGEGQKVNLLELSNGEIAGELVVSAFKMMPMAQSEQRNYRVLGIELLRTGV
jgi:hypothetical protein